MSGDYRSAGRPVWLAIILITATVVAIVIALLFQLADAEMTNTMAAAGAGFVATVTLGIAVYTFLAPRE